MFPTELGIIKIKEILKKDFEYYNFKSCTLEEYYSKFINKNNELEHTLWIIMQTFSEMIYHGNNALWKNSFIEIESECKEDYWKERCLAAEKYIESVPYIHTKSYDYYSNWEKIKNENYESIRIFEKFRNH